jgi:hypothetical protein
MKWGLVVAVTALGFGAAAAPAAAATFTVAGLGDPAGATCTGTVCDSLRAAVTAAEQPASVGSTVSLGGGTYTLGGPGSTGGPLSISMATSMTIAGSAGTTIRQTGVTDGVVAITSPTADVTLSDLTVTGGSAVGATALPLPPPTPGGAGQDAVGASSTPVRSPWTASRSPAIPRPAAMAATPRWAEANPAAGPWERSTSRAA